MDNKIAQRFWDRVLIGDGCWEWQAYRFKSGYGSFYLDGRAVRAHRIAYQLWYGVDPGDQYVLHSCDNRACCNPAHLSLGTHQENMRQMVERGRGADQKGETHGRSKLTEEDVLYIRNSSLSHRVLGAKYNVSHRAVWKIKHRETWTHI